MKKELVERLALQRQNSLSERFERRRRTEKAHSDTEQRWKRIQVNRLFVFCMFQFGILKL